MRTTLLLVLVTFACGAPLRGDQEHYLSDIPTDVSLTHEQQWGDLGPDTAASAKGGTGSPLRIGETVFEKGLGHHANGEITVRLDGQYTRFRSPGRGHATGRVIRRQCK